MRKETRIISSNVKASFFIEGTKMISIKQLQKLFGLGYVDIHLDGEIKGTLTLLPTVHGYTCQVNIEFTEREPIDE